MIDNDLKNEQTKIPVSLIAPLLPFGCTNCGFPGGGCCCEEDDKQKYYDAGD